uniref:Uncharacterized protein n=1 Tax=Rhodopseudomonas palustris (strain ATCC BAA-98 / CGA009) TaxID=258594 RepID=Q6NAY6_RHOPA|nr:hypothetical protein RPA1044 [Rhodopseudomonas palustris CGA009]
MQPPRLRAGPMGDAPPFGPAHRFQLPIEKVSLAEGSARPIGARHRVGPQRRQLGAVRVGEHRRAGDLKLLIHASGRAEGPPHHGDAHQASSQYEQRRHRPTSP